MNYATTLLDHLIKAFKRPNRRKLRRLERRLEATVRKRFEEQQKQIVKASKGLLFKSGKLYQQKAVEQDVDKILDEVDYETLIKEVLFYSALSLELGGVFRVKQAKLGQFGISFDLKHELAVQYLKGDRPLVLANMTQTTKEAVKPLLIQAVEQGWSPTQLAKELSDNFAFSKSRSLMIATHEVGKAYEVGNLIPMLDAKQLGLKAMKRWLTVGDDRVTPTHTDNERQGWIDVEETFRGTGDLEPPASDNPRCRCTMLLEIRN